MTAPNDDDEQEKPLDPAVERVRQRLVRFIAINLGILFIALMAVVIALVYRATRVGEPAPAEVTEIPGLAAGEVLEGSIPLPEGAQVVGHSLSGNRMTLLLSLADGNSAIYLYDFSRGEIVGRYTVTGQTR